MTELEVLELTVACTYWAYIEAENQSPDQLKRWLEYSDAKSAYQAALEQLKVESQNESSQ